MKKFAAVTMLIWLQLAAGCQQTPPDYGGMGPPHMQGLQDAIDQRERDFSNGGAQPTVTDSAPVTAPGGSPGNP